jgi:hypothetical protein
MDKRADGLTAILDAPVDLDTAVVVPDTVGEKRNDDARVVFATVGFVDNVTPPVLLTADAPDDDEPLFAAPNIRTDDAAHAFAPNMHIALVKINEQNLFPYLIFIDHFLF